MSYVIYSICTTLRISILFIGMPNARVCVAFIVVAYLAFAFGFSAKISERHCVIARCHRTAISPNWMDNGRMPAMWLVYNNTYWNHLRVLCRRVQNCETKTTRWHCVVVVVAAAKHINRAFLDDCYWKWYFATIFDHHHSIVYNILVYLLAKLQLYSYPCFTLNISQNEQARTPRRRIYSLNPKMEMLS